MFMYVRKNTKLIKKSISFLKPTNRHIVDYVTHMSVVSKNKSNYIPIRTENSSTLLLILKVILLSYKNTIAIVRKRESIISLFLKKRAADAN